MDTILITGASGFLGVTLVETIKKSKFKDMRILTPSSKELNLLESQVVDNFFKKTKIDYVIHLAADVGGIGYSRKHPGNQLYNNTLINTNIIHYSYKYGVKKLIGIGSVCEYPKFAKIPFNEDELWSGYPEETNAAYGISKRLLLEFSKAYKEQFGFNSVHLLLINLYGPNDNFDIEKSHVIPAIINKVYNAKIRKENQIVIWGDGSASREFIYVEDAAEAIILALDKLDEPYPINIGTGHEISILELTKKVMNLMDYKGKILFDRSKPNGQPRRQLNVSKAKNIMNFEAKTSLNDGLIETINFFYNFVLKDLN